LDKLFRFLNELIPLPNQQKHAILAAHLGKRWIFKELKWEDWQQGVLAEQERIVKRDKGNFDLEAGEKTPRTREKLPGLVFDKMGEYWDILTCTHPTEKEVDFIDKVVGKNGVALDLCCGTGRHDVLLVKKGWQIVGADLSKTLLRIAKNKMQKESASFPIVQCEMQNLPFRSEVFASVINMFTSFGYLLSEKEDLDSLMEIARALKPDGGFLLDVVNRDHLLRVFEESDLADFGIFTMEEKRSLDKGKMKVTSQWQVTPKDDGEKLVLTHELRLYTLEGLRQMLSSAGLAPKVVYGNYKAEDYNAESSRLIILAQKQKTTQSE
jgi:SAM-dependent methyltransferase